MKDGCHIMYSGQYWYKNGRFHREDGPGKILNNGQVYWCCNGLDYINPEHWAEAVIQSRRRPTKEEIKEFLRPILAKQTQQIL